MSSQRKDAADTPSIVGGSWSLSPSAKRKIPLDRAGSETLIHSVSRLDGRCRIAGHLWPIAHAGGGKSGLHGDTVAANGRRGRPQGKCHRKQTARRGFGPRRVRVKGCGKSAPRRRRRRWQGKPHREQDQIGVAGRAETRRQVRLQTRHPGWLLEASSNGRPRRMAVAEVTWPTLGEPVLG